MNLIDVLQPFDPPPIFYRSKKPSDLRPDITSHQRYAMPQKSVEIWRDIKSGYASPSVIESEGYSYEFN